MRRFAENVAWAVLAVCMLAVLALLSPALPLCELAFGEDDPAETYRRFW